MIAATARPVRVAGVNAFAQGAQRNPALTKVDDRAGDLGDRAAEPVDRSDHHGVAGPGIVEHCGQPGRAVLAEPESLWVNIRSESSPAALSATSWASRSWPVVLTLA